MRKTPEGREDPRRALLFSFLLVLLLHLSPEAGTARQSDAIQDPAADPTAGVSRYDARIRGLRFYRGNDHLYLDLQMTGAFIGDIRKRIESGLETSFIYTIEVYKKRGWWFDPRLARLKVITRVVHDAKTGRYVLTRLIDEEEVARESTEDPEAVRDWMARLEGVPLAPLDEMGVNWDDEKSKISVRAKAKVKDDFILWFIPWDFVTGWERLVLPVTEVPAEPGTDPGPTAEAPPAGEVSR